MEQLTVRMFCIGSCIFYGIALLLLLVGMAAPNWILVEVGTSESRVGLFEYCVRIAEDSWSCIDLRLLDQQREFNRDMGQAFK